MPWSTILMDLWPGYLRNVPGKVLIPLLFLTFCRSAAAAEAATPRGLQGLEPSSDVRLLNIRIQGLQQMERSRLLRFFFRLPVPGEYKLHRIQAAVERVRTSGYFHQVNAKYSRAAGKEGLHLELQVVERPVLHAINYAGNYLADLEKLDQLLLEAGVMRGRICNLRVARQALTRFENLLHNQGRFLFRFWLEERSHAPGERDWFDSLFGESAPKQEARVVLVFYFFRVPLLRIRQVVIEGARNVPQQGIHRRLTIAAGDTVNDDRVLARSLRRIRQLGIFSSVELQLRFVGKSNLADVVIRVKEVASADFNSSIGLTSRGAFTAALDYFNYSIGPSLARLSGATIFNFASSDLDFTLHYSLPYFLDRYFLGLQLKKQTATAAYDDTWDNVQETLDLDVTFGLRLLPALSAYCILNSSLSFLYYRTIDGADNGLSEQPGGERRFVDSSLGIMLLFRTVDDNFYPTRGIRTYLTASHSLLSQYQAYLRLDYKLEAYLPLLNRLVAALYGHLSGLVTSDPDLSLSLEERRRTTAQDDLALGVEQKKFSAFGSLEFRIQVWQDFYLVLFGESGGVWATANQARFRDLSWGIGLGLRVAPREHYFAHIFKYPWSCNIGYNISNKEDPELSFSVVSARDEYYYINLQSSF